MNPEIKAYQKLVDRLVNSSHDTVAVKNFREANFPEIPGFKEISAVAKSLTPEQRNVIADYIQDRFAAGMENVLYLTQDYKFINTDGVELPDMTTYGEGLRYDFLWRMEGGNWEDREED